MAKTYPKGRVVTVTAKIVLPENATHDEINEWINHCVFEQGSIAASNPLLPYGFEAEDVDWDDTDTYRVTTISDVRRVGHKTYYRIKKDDADDNRTQAEIENWVSPDDALTVALKGE